MKSVKLTIVSTCLLALVCMSTMGYTAPPQTQQDQPAQQEQAIRGDQPAGTAASEKEQRIEMLWQQVARLHQQIVALELNEQVPQSSLTQAAEKRPADQEGRASREKRAYRGDVGQSPDQPPGAVRGATASAGAQTEQLWEQVARVHHQLVAMAADKTGQPSATGIPESSRERPGQATTRAKDTDEPQSDQATRNRPAHQPQGSTDRPAGEPNPLARQLLGQYAALHMQIIQQEVATHKSSAVRPGSPGTSPQPGTIERPGVSGQPDQR